MRRLSRVVLEELPGEVATPRYPDDVRVGIVHFGVGNFHRAHQAMYVDRLLNTDPAARNWGICGIGLLERDLRMREALTGQDGLYTLTLRHPDGAEEVSVVGSIRRFLHASDEADAVLEQLVDPAVRIVSLTITEGGYVEDATGSRRAAVDELVAAETADGMLRPRTAFGWIVAALRERRRRGVAPFTVMSCDNVPGNGQVAARSVEAVARFVDEELAGWIAENVAFPSTMVDRITPVTVPADVERIRERLGVEDAWPVTAEPFEQWVLEDNFPTGRPDLAAVGVTVVDDVHAYETMKIRLLNGGHQAVAYIGQMAGHEFVHDALADPRIGGFVRQFAEQDAVPTLTVPEGVDVAGYIDELFSRFGNPAIADTLARLGTDASNRMPKFVIATLLDRISGGATPRAGARVVASWREFNRQAGLGRFSLDDESAEALLAAAGGAPVDFLTDLPTLAPLAEDPEFVRAYVAAAEALERGGAAALLDG